jgi:pimeloyl-ACP methyl ester carboxylesterase
MSSPTFVLVHGAWHNGTCWDALASELRAAGATVYTPNLLGHGDGDPSYTEITTMEDYTRPVREVIEASAEPVVLVGHSLGGTSLMYLGELLPDKIAHLVYITAALVPNGKAATDILFAESYTGHPDAQGLFALIAATDDGLGIRLNLDEKEGIATTFYTDCDATTSEEALKHLVAVTPMIAFSATSEITPERFGTISRDFVECTADHVLPLSIQQSMEEMVPGSGVSSLDSSHSPFLSMPSKVSSILLKVAQRVNA